jgi:hypothetical protein
VPFCYLKLILPLFQIPGSCFLSHKYVMHENPEVQSRILPQVWAPPISHPLRHVPTALTKSKLLHVHRRVALNSICLPTNDKHRGCLETRQECDVLYPQARKFHCIRIFRPLSSGILCAGGGIVSPLLYLGLVTIVPSLVKTLYLCSLPVKLLGVESRGIADSTAPTGTGEVTRSHSL